MSGTGAIHSIQNGEPPPFSDIIIPPSDYISSTYLEPNISRPNSNTSHRSQRLPEKIPTQHDSGVIDDLPPDFNRSTSTTSSRISPPTLHPRPTPQLFNNISDFQPQPRSSTRLGHIPEGDMPLRSKRPESLATKGHEYEELPTTRPDSNYSEVDLGRQISHNSHISSFGGFNNGRPLPPMLHKLQNQHSTATTVSTTDSNDNLMMNSLPQIPGYRSRQNPLYDSSEHEPAKSSKLQKANSKDSSKCVCLWWTLLLMTLIISLAGLCLSLYNFTYTQEDKAKEGNEVKTAMLLQSTYVDNRTLQETITRLLYLESQNQQLLEQVKEMQENISLLQSEDIGLNARVYQFDNDVATVRSNLSTNIHLISDRIDNIQLLPGPQGPPGVGNLSTCVHLDKSAGGLSSEVNSLKTPFFPASYLVHKTMVLLGVECSVEGGLYAHLVVRKKVDNPITFPEEYEQYQCECSGQVQGQLNRHCEMHYWKCPRIT